MIHIDYSAVKSMFHIRLITKPQSCTDDACSGCSLWSLLSGVQRAAGRLPGCIPML